MVLCILLAGLLTSCFDSGDTAVRRSRRAEKKQGDILIGAVAPWQKVAEHGHLDWNGIELAVKQVNAGGGIDGRKVRIVKKDDQASVNTGINIAQEFADDLDITAVIGHAYSFITMPASVIYEFNGVTMISPTASTPALTQRNFKYIFRVIPDDNDMGMQIAKYAHQAGYRKIVIYYIKHGYGLSLANAFEQKAEELGIQILDRLSYDSITKANVFYDVFSDWKENYSFDAVFLAARNPMQGAKIMIQARKAGVTVPFISGDALNSRKLIDAGGKAVEGTLVPSYYNPYSREPQVRKFIQEFEKEYHTPPDTWAALYYDAASVLLHAMATAGTADPVKVSETLHRIRDFPGITGTINFTEHGDVTGKKLYIKIVKDGRFQYVEKRMD